MTKQWKNIWAKFKKMINKKKDSEHSVMRVILHYQVLKYHGLIRLVVIHKFMKKKVVKTVEKEVCVTQLT